jgi:molybdenum cofactor cytidylyltransferase
MLSLIVLAAGKSTRLRGINKLLAEFNGAPIIRSVTRAAINSKVDEVIVVVGHEAEKVRKAISDLPCRVVINRNYELGQSSSLKTGMNELNENTKGVLILPGDIAKIDSASINRVVDAYSLQGGSILCAAHNGKLGHPILLAKELFSEIMQITEEKFGLKMIVSNHRNEIRLVETDSENVLQDVDYPDELNRLTGTQANGKR